MTGARIQLSTGVRSFSATDPGGWDHLFRQARLLDQAGFDRLSVSDHVVFGERLEAYARPELGGQAGGRQPTGPDGHWLEPLTTLSVLAGMTSRIRLATGILLAALRRPVVLAKSAATLDVLSRGRLDLGVGVGWQREEYQAAGLDFEDRGRRLDQTLEVCQTLWRDTQATYSSPDLHFENIHMMPKPFQTGGVPIWISGTLNPRVIKRLARFGTGWIPWGPDAADLPTAIARLRDALADEGRDPANLQIVGHIPTSTRPDGLLDVQRTMDAVPPLVAAGATDLRLNLRIPADDAEAAEHLHDIVQAFRAAADQTT
ncbi:TIGR03619 family F420-dependent LLM class oxidoreductase [Actinomadura rugatobispora]|uniref:TIGR03619 family F420-dependent LLM class oxidoreductase n=1 Tax=Actinomadura rugatobispora TaxID=1994 RepID=A0ABW0ZQZ2_9ACTN|nr:LLM class F420-dependent oxidoreductase [Actinomadura rugatobispora]